jgi:hypothetical protein
MWKKCLSPKTGANRWKITFNNFIIINMAKSLKNSSKKIDNSLLIS